MDNRQIITRKEFYRILHDEHNLTKTKVCHNVIGVAPNRKMNAIDNMFAHHKMEILSIVVDGVTMVWIHDGGYFGDYGTSGIHTGEYVKLAGNYHKQPKKLISELYPIMIDIYWDHDREISKLTEDEFDDRIPEDKYEISDEDVIKFASMLKFDTTAQYSIYEQKVIRSTTIQTRKEFVTLMGKHNIPVKVYTNKFTPAHRQNELAFRSIYTVMCGYKDGKTYCWVHNDLFLGPIFESARDEGYVTKFKGNYVDKLDDLSNLTLIFKYLYWKEQIEYENSKGICFDEWTIPTDSEIEEAKAKEKEEEESEEYSAIKDENKEEIA